MRKSVASPSASSSAESIPPAESSGSNTDTSSSSDRKVENGIDIFKMANLSDAIPGHFYSYKTGNPHYVRQVFSSLHDLALALYLEYYPLVQFYQRGDANRKCATREEIATPLGTPFPISYVWKNAVHTYYPDYVGKLIDGRLLIAEAGVAEAKRTEQELLKADAARQFAKAEGGVFWIATEEQLGSLDSTWLQNLVRLHGRRMDFPTYARIRDAVLCIRPWGSLLSIPDIVKDLHASSSKVEVEAALWKMIGDAAASGHLLLNLAEVPLKRATPLALLDPALIPLLPEPLPDSLIPVQEDSGLQDAAGHAIQSMGVVADSLGQDDNDTEEDADLLLSAIPELPGKSINSDDLLPAVRDRFERCRKAVYELLNGAPIRATARKYQIGRTELFRLGHRAREHGETALIPHEVHQGRPLLRHEFRELIRDLYKNKQLHTDVAIHEHPKLKKLTDTLTKQEGHAVLLPTLRQVRLEIKRYKAEAKRQAESANTKPATAERQTQLHPPRENMSTYSYVLSIAGPGQVVQVDEYYWDGLIITKDNIKVTMRVHAGVMVCVATGAIISFVLSPRQLVEEDYMLLVKRAIEPKDFLLQRHNCKHEWLCSARPSVILHDHGKIFTSKRAIHVIVDRLQIIEEQAPPYAPPAKGIVENLFNWINKKYAHRLRGTIKSSKEDRGAYDSEGEAVKAGITFDNLEEYFIEAIVDDYMQDWNDLRRQKRFQLWNDAVEEYGVVPYLGKQDDLKLLLMKAQSRKNATTGRYAVHDYKGISFRGRWYTNPNVIPYLHGDKVTIYYSRWDIVVIYLYRDNQYMGPVMCTTLLRYGRVSLWEADAMAKHDRLQKREANAETQQTRTAIIGRASAGKRAQRREALELERKRVASLQEIEVHPAEVLAMRDAVAESLRLQEAERHINQSRAGASATASTTTTPISVQSYAPPPESDEEEIPSPLPLRMRPRAPQAS